MSLYASARVRAEIDAARVRLARHTIDPFDGRCVVCGQPGPCTTANDAANFLVETGERLAEPEPVTPAPLLTFASRRLLTLPIRSTYGRTT